MNLDLDRVAEIVTNLYGFDVVDYNWERHMILFEVTPNEAYIGNDPGNIDSVIDYIKSNYKDGGGGVDGWIDDDNDWGKDMFFDLILEYINRRDNMCPDKAVS
jgi:hypothetical protein